MASPRVLAPARTVDPHYHQAERMAELERRIALLERKAGGTTEKYVRTFAAGTTGLTILSDFNGNNITGVRITGSLISSGTSTALLRLRPNGLSSFTGNAIGAQSFIGAGPSYTATAPGAVYGGAVTAGGLGIAVADLRDFAASSLDVYFQGVFFTKASPYRVYQGRYTSIDQTTDFNRMADTSLSARWHDTTTLIQSLDLRLDAGTMAGRVCVEILP